jgi:hypothetical protein
VALTGKLLKDESNARHIAVAVKVPDNRREHPQHGIDEADIVFVELEGYKDAQATAGPDSSRCFTPTCPTLLSRYVPSGPSTSRY